MSKEEKAAVKEERTDSNMNTVIVSGRLCVQPELRYTLSGTEVCSMVLAIDRPGTEEADFPTVIAWGKTAIFASKYLTKGQRIMVRGELRTHNYTDAQGARRKTTEIRADRIEFADGRKGGATSDTAGEDELPF